MQYFLGVDGGGTKTQTILADEHGNILGVSRVGATYIRAITKDLLRETLEEGITQALASASLQPGKIHIAKSCFGIAGLDNPKDFEMVANCVKEIDVVKLDKNPLVLNDAVCALRRGTSDKQGVVIVAGTGSNCFGRNALGKEIFVGGLGHILSDEGGSYYIGQNVLHSSAKSFDGRIEHSMLEDLVYESFGVTNMRDIILKVHERTFGKREIASLSVACEKAAHEGDKEALRIMFAAADELILMVKTVITKIAVKDEVFDLVCVGGSFKKADGPIRQSFETAIKAFSASSKFVYPTSEPAMGSVYLAMDAVKN